MVRKQLYLDADQDRALARRAAVLGVSQAELVRVAVDRFLSEGALDARGRAWEELKRTIDEIAEHGCMDGVASAWSRDDLHDR